MKSLEELIMEAIAAREGWFVALRAVVIDDELDMEAKLVALERAEKNYDLAKAAIAYYVMAYGPQLIEWERKEKV